MLLFNILILAISIFEIKNMVKNKQRKEIFVYCIITVLAIAIGSLYISNPYRTSLGKIILSLFNI